MIWVFVGVRLLRAFYWKGDEEMLIFWYDRFQ